MHCFYPFSLRNLFIGCALLSSTAALATPPPADDDMMGTNAYTTEMEPTPRPSSQVSAGVDLEYTPVSYSNYTWVDGRNHSNSGNGAHLGVEWIPFGNRIGKVGLGLGIGFYDVSQIQLSSGGLGEIRALPLEAFVSYRLDYWANQWIVPFVKVGPDVTFARISNMPGNLTYYGLDTTGGIELCLNRLDWDSAKTFERTVGVHNTYLIAEFVKSQRISSALSGPDLSHQEVRFGMRFEM